MIPVYAIALITGLAGLAVWVVRGGDTSHTGSAAGDNRGPGGRARALIGALSGFGLAGMSASFAGWHGLAAAGAAVVAAAALGFYASSWLASGGEAE
ncbi:MAG TPA: hypothetical protein VGC47_04880 [Acidimicrobiia bacterium]|jgi:hypothetical protein